ncbi:phosphotransferase [Maribacter polysaccharolyticus]|uniref:phosphotransferase n=1 Tax=Maribacter polysaccharolyticus TaxID=3020831 RepID=UPI00237F06F2|nr:hypothetical protein [Maribacter polysaccharolyticus]MDE3742038.1 hypothetical protein [Maribacter polysaccharolyticus]
MTHDQVNHIIDNKAFPYPTDGIKLIVTHISWVILTDRYVYKIKKPIRFSFLDFSTLEKRKVYCEKEVQLNKRLAPEMYLKVIPITENNGNYRILGSEGTIIDYAVLMKRMDETKQMDMLLEQGAVKSGSIVKLAEVLARFHQEATIVPEGEDWKELYGEFEDISSIKDFLERNFGKETGQFLEEVNRWAYRFLNQTKERIQERNEQGFVIEGHGDLHTRNIFLLEDPVIFDCIEFNDDFRKLDLLNEIAFLCMDLERFDRFDLSKLFLDHYLSKIHCIANKTDERLFAFYKLYRANVRLKIHAINAMATNTDKDKWQNELALVRQYLALYQLYYSALKRK